MSMDFGKLNFSTSFKPTSAFPLNANCYFESLTEAQAAAATAEEVGSSNTVYHYGQEIAVVENSIATLYLIQPDKTLKEVGSALVGDTNSIVVDGNKIKIAGIDSAETGAQLVVQANSDGTKKVAWVKSETTVEGLAALINGLESSKANKADVYTKTEVDTKLSAVYRYSGSVETYAELPTDLTNTDADIGKTYNVKKADKTHGVKAGDNVAWTGTAWDVLAGEVDLTAYSTTEQMNAELAKKVDAVAGSRLITEAEAERIAAAEPNVIGSVDTAQFNIDESKKLTLLDIAMEKVTGLSDALAARDNKIESVKVAGTALAITDKAVNIPLATADAAGVIKSSTAENEISVSDQGVASVTTVNVSKIVQTKGDRIILNGGTSAD